MLKFVGIGMQVFIGDVVVENDCKMKMKKPLLVFAQHISDKNMNVQFLAPIGEPDEMDISEYGYMYNVTQEELKKQYIKHTTNITIVGNGLN